MTFGVAVYGVNAKLGYNHICGIIGKKVLIQVFTRGKNELKEEATEFKLPEFQKSITDSDKDYVRLGSFLLDLLMLLKINLFFRKFNKDVEEVHTLEFNEENFNLIKDNLYIDPSSLPMVHDKGEFEDTKYGHFK